MPDARVDWLSEIYQPKKTILADIEFVDIPGSINDSADPKVIAAAREVEALVFVVKSFDNDEVLHPLDTIDPIRDYEQIKVDLILADMMIGEKRLEKLQKSVDKNIASPEEKLEFEALKKVMEQLENEKPASDATLTPQEEKALRSFQMLTLKPYLCLVNVSDVSIHSEETNKCLSKTPNSMAICANIET